MNLCDSRTVKNIMEAFGLHFRKEFGQNFLTNRMVVEDIADSCTDNADETILEIGPGIGTLTRELCARYRDVVALEIDKSLIPALGYTLGEFHNVTVINEDVMKADLAAILAPYFEKGAVSVCANLPYYITTPILMKLLESGLPFRHITIMIQLEVADRLTATAGTAAYGAITAVLNYYGVAERLFRVNAGNFLPPPKVDSAVVRITLHKEKPYQPKNEDVFFRTIRAAFEQRRKTLPNALSAGFPELTKEQCVALVEAAGHRADIRGERLSTAEFLTLADLIADAL
ncbi:MAG: 16S rRNA (adenine(1518)-N(6)/adenine(1519)-N(6))-dimethyltransferase RsmA [Clostridia bacterium]|nr:16S rRNA (adenine(1518)-N(6)/adenine(1519)-N(6))-dimethyltransferase RsmA [Clostridia bacterium]MBP3397183.1 16S rRNA (adenine(1518)-N(6)/adenine(1519)-N(6))-dimethyltransferase RsmA [Clostridia bacterium]